VKERCAHARRHWIAQPLGSRGPGGPIKATLRGTETFGMSNEPKTTAIWDARVDATEQMVSRPIALVVPVLS
jgi:hypothetical protein